MRQSTAHLGARRGFTVLELLIVVTLIAAMAGFVSMSFDEYVRDARNVRTRRELVSVQKAFIQAQRGIAVVPGSSMSPSYNQVPQSIEPVSSLVPRYFAEVPTDPWKNPIYRMGNYLVSNGADEFAGTLDDITLKVVALPPVIHADSGSLLSTRKQRETLLQAGSLALEVERYVRAFGGRPESLAHMYLDLGRASPPDTWGSPYQMIADELVSLGPDQTLGTDDDLKVPLSPGSTFRDDFSSGVHDWFRVFPSGMVGTSGRGTPVVYPPTTTFAAGFDPAKRTMRFLGRGGGVVGNQAAAWAKLPPAGFEVRSDPTIRASFEVDRIAADRGIEVGVFAYYSGHNSGYIAGVRLANDAGYARVSRGIPMGGGGAIAPASGGFHLMSDGVPASGNVQVSFSYLSTTGQVTLQVSGSFGSAALLGPAEGTPSGLPLHGVYFRGIGGGGAIVDVTLFEVSL